MKIHKECEQGSLEWHKLRAGIPTASEFSQLVTPGFQVRKWSTEMPNTYLARKLAEAWTGGPLDIFVSTREMEFGKILEAEARGWVSLETGQMVEQVAFITTEDGRVGCSPDGLIAEQCGVEIKCPEAPAHVKYVLGGEVPEQYLLQVYGSMYVTGLPRWRFASYRRGFPQLLLTVEWDDPKMKTIGVALAEFHDRFDSGMKLLEDKYGGPAPKDLWRPPPGFGSVHREEGGDPGHVFTESELDRLARPDIVP